MLNEIQQYIKHHRLNLIIRVVHKSLVVILIPTSDHTRFFLFTFIAICCSIEICFTSKFILNALKLPRVHYNMLISSIKS